MKAMFIGANGSMGLQYGAIYDVEAVLCVGGLQARYPITLKFDCKICPYESLESMFANWRFIIQKGGDDA